MSIVKMSPWIQNINVSVETKNKKCIHGDILFSFRLLYIMFYIYRAITLQNIKFYTPYFLKNILKSVRYSDLYIYFSEDIMPISDILFRIHGTL